MIMLRLTRPQAFSSIWPKTTSLPKLDLAPCDIFLFLKLNKVVKGKHFRNVETIKRAVTTKLKAIPEKSFQGLIDAWKKRTKTCIRLGGDYFEVKNV